MANAICAALPGAVMAHPADGALDSWKVGGKMFASFNRQGTGVSVKTADVETAALLCQVGHGRRAPYFHKSWIHIPWDLVDADEMADRLRESYAIVRAGLTQKVQATLGLFEQGGA